jgi:hypothetical protein
MSRMSLSTNAHPAQSPTAKTVQPALPHALPAPLATFFSPTQLSPVAFYHALTSTQPSKHTFPPLPTPQSASVATSSSATVLIVSTHQLLSRLSARNVLLDSTCFKMAHAQARARMVSTSHKESTVCHVGLIVVCVPVILCVRHVPAVIAYT